jgi:hypothetical protein
VGAFAPEDSDSVEIALVSFAPVHFVHKPAVDAQNPPTRSIALGIFLHLCVSLRLNQSLELRLHG